MLMRAAAAYLDARQNDQQLQAVMRELKNHAADLRTPVALPVVEHERYEPPDLQWISC
jgi:hypothetical protein